MKAIALIIFLVYFCKAQEYEFPADFLFGVSTAAYQIEGAWNESGKGETIWDYFIHNYPELVIDGSTGDVACDSYNRVDEDVEMLKNLGVDMYRFSISWSRILPNGKADYINPDGIRYYNELIDKLLENNIEPMVTMYHMDLPLPLHEEGGFLNVAFADYFEAYAAVLYENFGDRVKNWVTFNQPAPICENGYSSGDFPPYVNDEGIGGYVCSRILLIAHARAYHIYNDRYRETQGGRVGIVLNQVWYEPLTNSIEDTEATDMALQIGLGWFAHPLFSEQGDFPPAMKERVAQLSEEEGFTSSRLPELTTEEVDLIRGAADFFGLNFYTGYLCTAGVNESITRPSQSYDRGVTCAADPNWESTASPFNPVFPLGFRRLLNWIKNNYNNPEVIVTENGYGSSGNILDDCRRINFYNLYMEALLEAIHEDGCNVTTYMPWTLMDNFEWTYGYSVRYGLYSVDFEDDNRQRTPKMSSYVYNNIIRTRRIDWSYTPEGFSECQF